MAKERSSEQKSSWFPSSFAFIILVIMLLSFFVCLLMPKKVFIYSTKVLHQPLQKQNMNEHCSPHQYPQVTVEQREWNAKEKNNPADRDGK